MSSTISVAKAGAVASTVFLMGAYVWFQAKTGAPEVVADTTTAGSVLKEVASRPREVLPGPKSAPVEFSGLPGSKSDSVEIIPMKTPVPPPAPSPSRPKVLPG